MSPSPTTNQLITAIQYQLETISSSPQVDSIGSRLQGNSTTTTTQDDARISYYNNILEKLLQQMDQSSSSSSEHHAGDHTRNLINKIRNSSRGQLLQWRKDLLTQQWHEAQQQQSSQELETNNSATNVTHLVTVASHYGPECNPEDPEQTPIEKSVSDKGKHHKVNSPSERDNQKDSNKAPKPVPAPKRVGGPQGAPLEPGKEQKSKPISKKDMATDKDPVTTVQPPKREFVAYGPPPSFPHFKVEDAPKPAQK